MSTDNDTTRATFYSFRQIPKTLIDCDVLSGSQVKCNFSRFLMKLLSNLVQRPNRNAVVSAYSNLEDFCFGDPTTQKREFCS